jgi:prolyl-tRNA synthetase
MKKNKLPSCSVNFSEWYNQLVIKVELADYAPVRGCMEARPFGWALWKNIQSSLYSRALDYREAHTQAPSDYNSLLDVLKNEWAFSLWCISAKCKAIVKEDTKATTRGIPLNQPGEEGNCIVCGKPAKIKVYFARAN